MGQNREDSGNICAYVVQTGGRVREEILPPMNADKR